ncbi:capsid protein [Duck circovirus]|uniref:Capsid protein n=2 Tax=Duck circovirus TaxID=324685 RepID=B1PWC3_9CIRC|nr:capsid protein [Duck circovirus]ACV69944.1 cap [Muscovy duck circovirus]ACZ04328.1 capsid protein [Duck circovirus]AFU74097.1 capsid protein [Muscovy duck circovirus]AHK80899.1 capsid protein [Duck circovirus]
MRRSTYRRAYRARRRRRGLRRRLRRRRLRIGRPRRRFSVVTFKVTRHTVFGFFGSGTGPTAAGRWQSLSLEDGAQYTDPPAQGNNICGLNMRWAMFGDTNSYMQGNKPQYHYPYDYYIIKGVAVTLRPAYNIYQKSKTQGSTIIDKDGQIVRTSTTGWAIDPYGSTSSRRTWDPSRIHRRYFVPKPTIQGAGQGSTYSTFFLGGKNFTWINCSQDQVVHYGMGMSLRKPDNATGDEGKYDIEAQFTFYIKFGQFTGF